MTDAATDDDEIGRLFAVAPAAFVKERTAVVKTLKAAGRREEAAGVEKLPRPTASVWAVNQLARQAPALVRRLVAATERLQTGDHAGYAAALAEHREALKALRFEAERTLEAGALRSAPELLARVVHDLRAGVLDPETRPLIERGRLVRDVAEEGSVSPFVQEPGSVSPAAPVAAPPPDDTQAKEAARRAREQRLRALREAAATAVAARDRDEAEVDAARLALAAAERRLLVSRGTAAGAIAALEAAESDP